MNKPVDISDLVAALQLGSKSELDGPLKDPVGKAKDSVSLEDMVNREVKDYVRVGNSYMTKLEPGQATMGETLPEPPEGVVVPPQQGAQRHYPGRKFERYEHRIIAELKLTGRTAIEIANIIGYTPEAVKQVLNVSWVKDYIHIAIATRGGQDVINFMSTKAMEAAEIIVKGFVEESMVSRKDRVDAANKLLDRVFGRPNQPITHNQGTDLTQLSDAELESIARGAYRTSGTGTS